MSGRAPRPSKRGKAPPALSATNAAKFLHLQVLMSSDLLENYTTFGGRPGGRRPLAFQALDSVCFWAAQRFIAAFQRTVPMASADGVPADYALRNVSSVISGGTPIRTGKPNVPSPRFT